MTPRDELMARLEIAQKNCFDRNEFGIAELIQDARVELSRVSRPAQSRQAPEWIQAADLALKSYEADYGEPLDDMHELGRIEESRESASFRIRVGHIREIVAALRAPEAADAPKQLRCEMCASSKWKDAYPECNGTGWYTPDPAPEVADAGAVAPAGWFIGDAEDGFHQVADEFAGKEGTTPLYASPTDAGRRERTIEECAKEVEPKSPRPCDCERCNCGNRGDAEAVASWDADAYNAKIIRALAHPSTDGKGGLPDPFNRKQVEAVCRAICKFEGLDPDENITDDPSDPQWTVYADIVARALTPHDGKATP